MVTKATGRPRGRPPLALRDDPERYPIAHFVARLTVSSPRYAGPPHALAKIIMQAHHGIIDTAETRDAVSDALLGGRDFRISMKKLGGRNDANNKDQWRDRDSANAMADNFCNKVRKLGRKLIDPTDAEDATSDQKDAYWLALMSTAWRLAIGVYTYRGDPSAESARLAAKAGESDHFCEVIAPQFVACSSFRAPEVDRSSFLARINSPDLNPNDRGRIPP
jgi:hypothetical protein